ncbi:UNVERIFIED_CONTAM: hypothetical protein FKN15_020896 [Acipenser sinensis]
MEEVRSSWERPASDPSALKQATPLASLEGAEKLGLVGLPPVDSTIAALVKAPLVGGLARDPACPNPQCRVTEMHLKWAYAAEVQATRQLNTVCVLMAYMDGVLREAPLTELVATELRLLSDTLLQMSGLQGQALGQCLYSLIVAHRQLWLSQARVPALLDPPISPEHTFGPAVEGILQKSNRLGLTINDAKSRLTPVQCTTYLGLWLDSSTMCAHLSDDSVAAIQRCSLSSSRGVSSLSGPQVIQENLVLDPVSAVTRPALGDPTAYGSPESGERHSLEPGTGQVPAMGLAPERDRWLDAQWDLPRLAVRCGCGYFAER